MDVLYWLRKPKGWKFVCCVSYVVGLLCFALSSSFHDLFGKWTNWKILLYIVFSFIMGLALWSAKALAKARQGSTSPWLQVNSSFLVLLTTSVYSYFFDRQVKRKPDVYSLLSSTSFAVMSLGLSTLSCFGFEVDLLTFFIGVLITQLMKINVWLVLFGGSFGYSLFFLGRTLNFSQGTGDNTDQNHSVIDIGLRTLSSGSLMNSSQAIVHPRAYATRDQTIAQFRGHIEELRKQNGNLIDIISGHVHKYLKANVLNENQISVQEMQEDENLVVDALPSEMIKHLRDKGWNMVINGLEREFYHMYTSCRKEFLKECMRTVGLQVDEVNAEDIENMVKIEKWIKALNVAVRILFPNERRLCDLVFRSSSDVFPSSLAAADFTLREVCQELNSHLLGFVKTLSTQKNHSNFSHVITNVLKTLSDLIPNFSSLFYGQLFSGLLTEEAVDIFEEMKSLVPHEGPQTNGRDYTAVRL